MNGLTAVASGCETRLSSCPDLQSPLSSASCDEAHWYAVYSRSRHEKCVREYLERIAVEAFLPLYESVRRWKDRRVVVTLPVFPGYQFVRIPLADRMKVVTIPGVVGLVGTPGNPVPVPEQEIEALRTCYARNLKLGPHPYLTSGRKVLVKNGPFADLEGILIRQRGAYRVVISINLIARSVALEVNTEDIVLAPLTRPRLPDREISNLSLV